MAKNRKAQLDPSKIRVGYNSHGAWSTLEEIRCEEVERGNYFPKLDYPPGTLAMWICLTSRKALRYVALAERWDHLNDETQPLTCEEEEMLECVAEIPLEPTDITVHDDGDEGYLVLRPNKARALGKPAFLCEHSTRLNTTEVGWLDPKSTYDPCYHMKEYFRKKKQQNV
jgi:hypothetical protein